MFGKRKSNHRRGKSFPSSVYILSHYFIIFLLATVEAVLVYNRAISCLNPSVLPVAPPSIPLPRAVTSVYSEVTPSHEATRVT